MITAERAPSTSMRRLMAAPSSSLRRWKTPGAVLTGDSKRPRGGAGGEDEAIVTFFPHTSGTEITHGKRSASGVDLLDTVAGMNFNALFVLECLRRVDDHRVFPDLIRNEVGKLADGVGDHLPLFEEDNLCARVDARCFGRRARPGGNTADNQNPTSGVRHGYFRLKVINKGTPVNLYRSRILFSRYRR